MVLHRKIDPIIRVGDAVKVLTYIIGATGFLSVVRHVGLPFSLAFGFLFVFSLYFERRKVFPVPRWALNAVSVPVIASAFFRVRADNIAAPFLEALLLLLAIKFLEDKKFRDFMQIYAMSVFLLAGSSLMSLDIAFLLYFVSLIVLFAAAAVLLAYYSQDSAMELAGSVVLKIVLISLSISLVSIPSALLLFVILPRTSYPMLDFLNRGAYGSTGFTENVRLGGISGIQEDTSVIMRVGMEKTDERRLYWRGIVLDRFDGVAWSRSHWAGEDTPLRSDVPGRRVWQSIYLEPYGNKYLFALDRPITVPLARVQRNRDFVYVRPGGVYKRIKYQALSALGDVLPERDVDREAYLQLPARDYRKIRELIKRYAPGTGEEETLREFLALLQRGAYRYSMKELPVSPDPLDDFLFRGKKGNCEYFASAMAVMLRLKGIPSRLVGGYRGGAYNEIGKYYIVSQRNAHVWVEAYINGKGWVRVDPTPVAEEGSPSGLMGEGVLLRLRMLFDTVNYYWNASVLGYDLEGQMSLLQKAEAGFRKPHLRMPGRTKVIRFSLIAFAVLSGALMLYYAAARRSAPEERLLGAFLRKMEKSGYVKTRSEGLEEFAARIGDGRKRDGAYRFVRAFEECYYRDKRISKEEARRLRQFVRDI